MTGTGAPSLHGASSAGQDRNEGWENKSTPREMVTLMRQVLQNNVLSNISETRFWNTMMLDGDSDGVNEKSYIASLQQSRRCSIPRSPSGTKAGV